MVVTIQCVVSVLYFVADDTCMITREYVNLVINLLVHSSKMFSIYTT